MADVATWVAGNGRNIDKMKDAICYRIQAVKSEILESGKHRKREAEKLDYL